MRLSSWLPVFAVGFWVLITPGCRVPRWAKISQFQVWESMRQKPPQVDVADDISETELQRVSHQDEMDSDLAEAFTANDPFEGMSELPIDLLISAVQDRNPSLQAAQAACSAAAERFPQAVALEDPMLQTMFAPASFASNNSQPSYYLGAAQRIPWLGKRSLRGEMAQWESSATSWDAEEVKLHLAVASRMAFLDYYLVRREFELNEKNVEILQDFRSTAKSKYEANQVSQQDLSAADLELAKLKQQQLELRQAERIALARINTLLHRQPDHPLPPPPSRLNVHDEIPDLTELRQLASAHRPELAAIKARVQSEQSAVALACKQYCPDFEFMGRYDAFWTDTQQRPQVGMNMNVPIQRTRLGAAVREAQFRVTKMLSEYAQKHDAVIEEVEIAFARVDATSKTSTLYELNILPAAQANLDAALAAYIAGTVDFMRLMEARRQFIEQQIGYQRTLTEYQRSHADLERAIGTNLSN